MKLNKYLIFLCCTAVLFASPGFVFSQSKTDIQNDLERQLQDIQAQIDIYSKELGKAQSQKKTLINKIKQLQTKQKALQLQIKETSLKLTALEDKIGVVEKNIGVNLIKEEKLNAEITATLREINQVDNNFIVALVTADGFAAFLNQIREYSEITNELTSLRAETRNIRAKLEDQQNVLEDQKDQTSNLLKIKSIQQNDLLGTLKEQNGLLDETKGLESNYQVILSDQKKRAAEIRNRMYELFDTGKQITFGQAVEIAKYASNLTGIRPAFLLAILTQESNLGKNVGTCNRPGDPPEKSWKVIMKPTRDQEPFKTITAELGLDPDQTPVSCPMRDKKGKQVGWGGAMGPAQFIPSTWMGYKDRISTLTGKKPADPWDIRDAFVAASLMLKANGADGTDDGDWKAAMRYFSGSTNTQFRFYGDNVLSITKQYLQDIADLR
jgi:peptidoglycan hydrolase CwlO-like protein